MNFEDLKSLLGDLDTEPVREEADLDAVRQKVMKSRRRFDLRDIRETVACVLVFLIFWPIVFAGMPWMTRLGSLVCCIGAVFIASSLYLGRRRHRVLPELSVHEFLQAEIAHLDYQIRLLRNISWWYLAPCAVGYLMFVWGLMPISEAVVASGGYFVLDRVICWLNQYAVKHDLMPQKEELVSVWQSLDETGEVKSVSDFPEE